MSPYATTLMMPHSPSVVSEKILVGFSHRGYKQMLTILDVMLGQVCNAPTPRAPDSMPDSNFSPLNAGGSAFDLSSSSLRRPRSTLGSALARADRPPAAGRQGDLALYLARSANDHSPYSKHPVRPATNKTYLTGLRRPRGHSRITRCMTLDGRGPQ